MKILVAEDDLTSRHMLKAVLEKWGFEVVCAADGVDALNALQADDAPHLALVDWEMPQKDGAAVCREMRKQPRKEPLYLILLTAKNGHHHIVEGLDAGADDFISKPFNNDELRARINAGRRIISLQNELAQREKLEGVLEMAGAVCHELNQPMQTVSGFSELLLMDLSPEDPNFELLQNIKQGIERLGELTRKIMKITRYKSKTYMNRQTIVDIEEASRNECGTNDS